jgi:hypothetical protein
LSFGDPMTTVEPAVTGGCQADECRRVTELGLPLGMRQATGEQAVFLNHGDLVDLADPADQRDNGPMRRLRMRFNHRFYAQH